MMQAYPEYMDSGVDWLGEVPAEWELRRNKFIFEEKTKVVGKDAKKFKLLSLTLGGIIPRDMENPKGKFPAEFDTYKQVSKNDLVFCLFDVEETPRAVGIADEAGMITGAYTVLKSNPDSNPSFLNYLYLSVDNGKQLKSLYTGLRNVIKIDTFMSLETPYPDIHTQTAIAEFLDEKNTKIERLVEIKRRQIELLAERKQILIQNAVTKGLTPDAPMKDSGVEWIGQIPAHWEVKRLKHLGRFINGFAFKSAQFTEFGVRVMKISNIQTMKIDWNDDSYLPERCYSQNSDVRVYKNDLVFALTRPVISSGIKSAIVDSTEKILLNQRNAILRPNSKALLTWLYYTMFTSGFVGAFEAKIDNTGQQPNISTKSIGELLIALPPLNSQQRISDFIRQKTKKIDDAITIKQSQITKLNEYKTTLINAAVTGKIRVA